MSGSPIRNLLTPNSGSEKSVVLVQQLAAWQPVLRLVKMRPSSPSTPSWPVPPEIQSLPQPPIRSSSCASPKIDVVAAAGVDGVVAGLAVHLVAPADVDVAAAAAQLARAGRERRAARADGAAPGGVARRALVGEVEEEVGTEVRAARRVVEQRDAPDDELRRAVVVVVERDVLRRRCRRRRRSSRRSGRCARCRRRSCPRRAHGRRRAGAEVGVVVAPGARCPTPPKIRSSASGRQLGL